MKTLHEIGLSNGTDKATTHKFCDFYAKYFERLRQEPLFLLEIGIFKGESLRMWKEYFENGIIKSVDVDPSRLFTEPRISTELCDQGDRKSLAIFDNEIFHIIIDDGGHKMSQQQISFGTLFKNLVPGGFYVIEDLHSSFMPIYTEGGPYESTTLFCLGEFQRTGIFKFPHLTDEENKYLSDNVASVEIFWRSDTSITSMIVKK